MIETLENQIGKHRIEAVLAYEAEFDILDTTNLKWGLQDQFFVDNGYVYYYKPWLEKYLQEDISMVAAETTNGIHSRKPYYDEIVKFLGHEVPEMTPQHNLNLIRNVISKNPPGLPKFIVETPMFFQFELDGTRLQNLTMDDITRADLDAVKKYVTGDYNPFLTPYFAQSLYYSENRHYCMDILAYYYNPTAQFGIFLNLSGSKFTRPSLRYPNAANNSYFFTFRRLNEEEKNYVRLLGKLHTDHAADTIIVEYDTFK